MAEFVTFTEKSKFFVTVWIDGTLEKGAVAMLVPRNEDFGNRKGGLIAQALAVLDLDVDAHLMNINFRPVTLKKGK